jgi:hypothetical protein
MAIIFGFDTLGTSATVHSGGIFAPSPPVNTISPPPTALPSGAVPSSVAPTSTVGTGGGFNLTNFLNGFASTVSGLGAQSSQGGAVASGSSTAGAIPSTAQQLLASPVVWIAGGALLLLLLLPKRK